MGKFGGKNKTDLTVDHGEGCRRQTTHGLDVFVAVISALRHPVDLLGSRVIEL